METTEETQVRRKKISLLIPAYNEEKSLPALRQALDEFINGPLSDKYDFEVLFINDGSSDRTLEIIDRYHNDDPRFCYVGLSRNFGKENAMLAGFDYVTGDCTVVLDADLQDPLDVIPEMIAHWEDGYEDVYAKRRKRGRESWLRKRLSLTFYKFLQNSTRFDVLPNVGDFRLLDRRCILALRELRETQRYTKGLFCWIGYKKKEVLFDRADRAAGNSSFNIRRLFNLAVEGITSFSTTPLRYSSVLGIIIAFFSFVFLLYFLIKTLVWGDPIQGFPTLICVILMLGGLQLFAIGIIGEYIGRIFLESKQRPPYIASIYNGKKI